MGGRHDDPEMLVQFLDAGPYVAALVGETGEILWVSDAVERTFGYTVDETIGTNIFDYLDLDWDPTAIESIGSALAAQGLRLPMLFRATRRDGTQSIVEVWANSQLHNPVLGGLVVYVRRWDERVLLDEALETLARGEPVEATLRLLLDAMACETLEAEATILYHPDTGRFGSVISAAGLDPMLTGVSHVGEGTPWARALESGERQTVAVADLPGALRDRAVEAGFGACWAWPVRDSREQAVAACIVAWRRSNDLEPDQSRAIAMNRLARITELCLDRAHAIASLHYAATHDALTRLTNRAYFYEALGDATRSRRRGDTGKVGVLYLDLDSFKPVNDRLGHSAGDAVLGEVALRLSLGVRHGDVVARLGGDEFAVLCPDIESDGELEALAQRLLDTVQAPLTIAGETVSVGVSIGISTGERGACTADDLVEAADAALMAVKSAGKRGWRLADAASSRS